MAKSYLAKNCKKHSFVFDLRQSGKYEDHMLALDIAEDIPFLPVLFLKATARQEIEKVRSFLFFPEKKKGQDSFRIFNTETGKVLTKYDSLDKTYSIICEMDFDPNDTTKSQIFKFKEIPGEDLEIQFLSNNENVYGCEPTEEDRLVVNNSAKGEVPKYSNLVPGAGESLPSLQIKKYGPSSMHSPKLRNRKFPDPPKKPNFFASRVVSIPFFMVKDDQHDLAWKVKNSPWYYLRRQMRLVSTLDWFLDNPSPSALKHTNTTTVGFSETDSRSFTVTAGIKASASGGAFGVNFGVEVSAGLSYTTEKSLTDSYTKTTTIEMVAAPYTTIMMWQQESTFTMFRADGTEVGKWVKNDGGHLFSSFSHKNKADKTPSPTESESKIFILKPTEDKARSIDDDGKVGDFAPVATRVVEASKAK